MISHFSAHLSVQLMRGQLTFACKSEKVPVDRQDWYLLFHSFAYLAYRILSNLSSM